MATLQEPVDGSSSDSALWARTFLCEEASPSVLQLRCPLPYKVFCIFSLTEIWGHMFYCFWLFTGREWGKELSQFSSLNVSIGFSLIIFGYCIKFLLMDHLMLCQQTALKTYYKKPYSQIT